MQRPTPASVVRQARLVSAPEHGGRELAAIRRALEDAAEELGGLAGPVLPVQRSINRALDQVEALEQGTA